jgi:hypothetical protein
VSAGRRENRVPIRGDVNLQSENAVAVPTHVANNAYMTERLWEHVLVRRQA